MEKQGNFVVVDVKRKGIRLERKIHGIGSQIAGVPNSDFKNGVVDSDTGVILSSWGAKSLTLAWALKARDRTTKMAGITFFRFIKEYKYILL